MRIVEWFKNSFILPKKIQSLHIAYSNGRSSCSMALIEKSASGFVNTFSFADITFEEALAKVDPKLPIILTIDGKGIAHKKIINNPNTSIIQQALPNAKEADFFIQQYKIDPNTSFISLARKDMIDKLISLFKQKNLSIIALNLGVFNIEALSNYLDNEMVYTIQDVSIHISDGKIVNLGTKENLPNKGNLQIAGEIIEAPYLLPLASAVAFLSGQQYNSFEGSFPILMVEEFQYKKLFITGSCALLISVFIVLLINFSLYSHYQVKLKETQSQVGLDKDLLIRINTLKQELEVRKKLSNANNLSRNSRFSYYSDRVSACRPIQVLLTEMKECPVLGKIKDNSEIAFEKDKIEIKGTALSSTYVNLWITAIEKEKWVKKVDIISYKMEGETNPSTFEMHIQINAQDVR